MLRTIALIAVLSQSVAGTPLAKTMTSFKSGVPWYDTSGTVIDAHGAGLLGPINGMYYWYGSRRIVNASGTQMDDGIALYSSADLYAWKYESIVLKPFNCTSNDTTSAVKPNAKDYPPPSCLHGNGLDLERPKVIQCGGPGGKFIMWVRGTGYGNTPQLLGILSSDTPKGPFVFVSNKTGSDDPFHTIAPGIKNFPAGYQYADATLFQDPKTFKSYVYWRTRMTKGLDGNTGIIQYRSNCISPPSSSPPSSSPPLLLTCTHRIPSHGTHVGLPGRAQIFRPANHYHRQSRRCVDSGRFW
jgi:hypothetical protein